MREPEGFVEVERRKLSGVVHEGHRLVRADEEPRERAGGEIGLHKPLGLPGAELVGEEAEGAVLVGKVRRAHRHIIEVGGNRKNHPRQILMPGKRRLIKFEKGTQGGEWVLGMLFEDQDEAANEEVGGALDDFRKKVFFGAEVTVDEGFGDIGFGGDAFCGCASVAVVGEAAGGGV